MGTVLTISAVDPATDQLTITAHGLNTGDGPAAVYTDGGAIPGGLAAVTDTWVIRVDANTVKLASSSANALASVAIDITDAGSGTLELLLGIPYRRARTYTPKSQVPSPDLNAIQDDLVALWNLITGQAQTVYSKIAPAVPLVLDNATHGSFTAALPAAGGAGTMSFSSAAARSSAGGQTWYMPLTGLRAGDRLLAGDVVFAYQRSGGTVTMSLVEYDVATGALSSTPYSATDSTTSGSIQNKNVAGSDFTLAAGKFYMLEFTSGGTSDVFTGVSVSWARP